MRCPLGLPSRCLLRKWWLALSLLPVLAEIRAGDLWRTPVPHSSHQACDQFWFAYHSPPRTGPLRLMNQDGVSFSEKVFRRHYSDRTLVSRLPWP